MTAQQKTNGESGNCANLELWNRLFQTPPSVTKSFRRAGGFSGTAIQPQWCIKRATEEFGPMGQGWGFTEVENKTHVHTDGQTIWMSRVRVWYRLAGKPEVYELQQWGQTMMVVKRSSGEMFIDEEAPKKAVTDAVMKCLSYLGLGGDIHMGLFDDSKYVAEQKIEERKARERTAAEERRAKKAEEKPKPEAKGNGHPPEPGPDDEEDEGEEDEGEEDGNNEDEGGLETKASPPKFDPLSWRDKCCADLKILKTEKAVRNWWMAVEPTINQLAASVEEDAVNAARFVHKKARERLSELRQPAE